MTFAKDRDLLAIEPNLFRDVPWLSQQRVKSIDGVLAGTTLTSASVDFEAAQTDTGAVVLVAGLPLEVVSRSDANTLEISMVRSDQSTSPIPPGDGSGMDVVVRTFQPQAQLMHDALLRLIGIDEDDPGNELSAAAIVSTALMKQLEALGTLERVYAAAFALSGANEAIHDKARHYRGRFRTACFGASILIDTDGDGAANIKRPLGTINWQRV